MKQNIYNQDLDQNPANYQPLTPLLFLERAAKVFPEHIAIIYGDIQITYAQFYNRCRKAASALLKRGVGRGDTVSVILANTPAMLEAHYAIPMCGAVLHSLNTRLDSGTIAYQLEHAESQILIYDTGFSKIVSESLESLAIKPMIIDYHDPVYPNLGNAIGELSYEELVLEGDENFQWIMPENEWDAITVNYTSGTTGKPKGVVYHHRGACLLAQGNALTANLPKHAVYLWTLPMFHCNGWCFPWTISAVNGTHVCLREVRAPTIWKAIEEHQITHLCGAPIVMSTILDADQKDKKDFLHTIEFFTAAAPPSEKILANMQKEGFKVIHLYGLTEVYGPAVINDWHQSWNQLPQEQQATLKARQGVRYHALEELNVVDPTSYEPVQHDGTTLGEVVFRGNIVMKGYLKNKKATDEAFLNGWFRSGDLAVIHPDGYIQLKDRAKDIIISGGENISSIEIEEVLNKHDEVIMASVVAMPDEKWGETPCAFIEAVQGHQLNDEILLSWCKKHMASFKTPKRFIFMSIPKTSTGKVQKFNLRQLASKL